MDHEPSSSECCVGKAKRGTKKRDNEDGGEQINNEEIKERIGLTEENEHNLKSDDDSLTTEFNCKPGIEKNKSYKGNDDNEGEKDSKNEVDQSCAEEEESIITSNKRMKRIGAKRNTNREDESLATRKPDNREKLNNSGTQEVLDGDEAETFSSSLIENGITTDESMKVNTTEPNEKKKKKTKFAKNAGIETDASAETCLEKPCPKVTGINAGALHVLGSGGIKGTSLPLLLSMSTGGGATGGLSLLPAGLPPGRYVILPSTTSSVPSVTSIAAATTIHSGAKFLTAPTVETTSSKSVILSTTASSMTPLHFKTSPSMAPLSAGRFNNRAVKAALKGTFGNRGSVTVHGRRKSYTAAEKLAMIAAVESGQKKSAVADMFGVAPSTLACILLQKHKIRSDQDLSRRRLRNPKLPMYPPGVNRAIASKDLAIEEGELPFGTHFLSPQSPYPMFNDDSPEEIVSIPDFEDRLSGGEGSSVPKLEAESGSFLSCASAGSPSGIDDTDRPGLHLQNPLTAREEQSYYDEDDDTIKLKTESPAEIEIDDENIVDNTRSSSPVSRPQSPSQSGMTGPYLLKKETHCSSILDELLKDDTFTDVTLTAEGQHLKAHRIILCLSSKYFKDVLSKESATKNIIFFRDIKFEELKNIITFIYTGEVTVDASDLESFMKTAELLEVTSLCEGHKNFPKGFPISQPSEPHRIFKPTGTAKRTISNSSYSPPTKSRKTISGAETTSSPMKSRRKRSQPTALSSFVTIKTEPDVTEGEYFSECESREDQLETSNAFVDVGHLSEEELQPTTPFKDESKSDNDKDSDSLQLNDTPPVSGRCPFCPPSRQLFADATMLTHLQVSHPEETAYPCDVCYTVFTKKLSFLNHHKDCKR